MGIFLDFAKFRYYRLGILLIYERNGLEFV